MEDPSAVHTRAKKLFNSIEFQLQQLEEQDSTVGGGRLTDDDSMRRHAITENLNRLSNEVSLLDRVVTEAYGGVAAASAKADLWRKYVDGCRRTLSNLRNARAQLL